VGHLPSRVVPHEGRQRGLIGQRDDEEIDPPRIEDLAPARVPLETRM
jgi:hypothetical protein